MDKAHRLAARARCDAATPGPWSWVLNLKSRAISLQAHVKWLETVMDFVRWGMAGACPRFQTRTGEWTGIMHPAHTMAQVVPGREHHAPWHQAVSHPDADFIANARVDLPAALDALDAAEAEAARLREVARTAALILASHVAYFEGLGRWGLLADGHVRECVHALAGDVNGYGVDLASLLRDLKELSGTAGAQQAETTT